MALRLKRSLGGVKGNPLVDQTEQLLHGGIGNVANQVRGLGEQGRHVVGSQHGELPHDGVQDARVLPQPANLLGRRFLNLGGRDLSASAALQRVFAVVGAAVEAIELVTAPERVSADHLCPAKRAAELRQPVQCLMWSG